ncbi:MAG: recombination protein RecR [Chloroflexi bacterium]|nr:MAG: recombination protein RecR [Chloroflexota bacterium]
MAEIPASLARVMEELGRLPGIGPKTAQRLSFYLLRTPRDSVERLAAALIEVKARIRFCADCFFIAEAERCTICLSGRRDRTLLCVVEEPLDVLAIERTGEYHGIYHVLQGALSPIDGIGPNELRVAELLARLRREPVSEVILATDPDMEGEATAAYLAQQVGGLGMKTSRLAHGLPVGGELEYADELTLARAFSGRRLFQ